MISEISKPKKQILLCIQVENSLFFFNMDQEKRNNGEQVSETSHLEHTNTPWVHFPRTASHDVSHHNIIQCRVDQELHVWNLCLVQKVVFHKNVSEPLPTATGGLPLLTASVSSLLV